MTTATHFKFLGAERLVMSLSRTAVKRKSARVILPDADAWRHFGSDAATTVSAVLSGLAAFETGASAPVARASVSVPEGVCIRQE